uniref:Prefoldin subunit 6 n=1 Tax=Terrapene triunguis TaxID=2587831 RepID=A0A674JZK7_9SAUR
MSSSRPPPPPPPADLGVIHLCCTIRDDRLISGGAVRWAGVSGAPYGAAALQLMGFLCVCPSDLSKSMAARQKLEAQLTENNIVKEELGLLDATNTVYKLIGPVLVKQDMDEAKATVSKRLDYIAGEMYVCGGKGGFLCGGLAPCPSSPQAGALAGSQDGEWAFPQSSPTVGRGLSSGPSCFLGWGGGF